MEWQIKRTAAVVIAQVVCASLAWGYTNPIENQTTETIYDDTWDLGGAYLYIGKTTPGNGMRIAHGGIVTNHSAAIG